MAHRFTPTEIEIIKKAIRFYIRERESERFRIKPIYTPIKKEVLI